MAGTTRTQTQTIRPAVPHNGSRPLDYVYDSVHTLSAARDHARVVGRASNATHLVPSASNMFSELTHHPRATLVLKARPGMPSTTDYQAHTQQMEQDAARSRTSVQVTGRDLYRFRGQPLLSSVAPSQLPSAMAAEVAAPAADANRTLGTRTRTVHVQTDYRESETQTDAWAPGHVVRPGSAPEVLMLASLSFNHGLRAGLAEVEMIERARAKRRWEKSLPQGTDPASSAARLRLMEEQEAYEWQVREQEIARLQQQRLERMKEAMETRNRTLLDATTKRVQHGMVERERAASARVAKTHQHGLMTLRKLTVGRTRLQQQSAPPAALAATANKPLVRGYTDAASGVYAGAAREGACSRDHCITNQAVRLAQLETYQGLLELEAGLPEALTTPRLVRPPKQKQARGAGSRNSAKLHTKLNDLDRTFKLTRNLSGTATEPPLRFCEKVEPPPIRPPTPSLDTPDQNEEKRQLAIILLQKMLRGRASQTAMYEGKEAWKDLITEVRSTHALLQAEQAYKVQQKAQIQAQHAARQQAAVAEQAQQEAIGQAAGAVVGRDLDFLSKELVRLQEERRIHAFALLAERERRLREAKESGRRAEDEWTRARRDEVFRHIVQVHQATIDSYLEDILLEATSAVADNQARVEIREKARQIDRAAAEEHESGWDETEAGALTVAAQLVNAFLLPEVDRQTVRRNIHRDQRRFLHAAHQV